MPIIYVGSWSEYGKELMKKSKKITIGIILFFVIITVMIVGRYSMGLYFEKKFSKRPPPGIIVEVVTNKNFSQTLESYCTSLSSKTTSFKIKKNESIGYFQNPKIEIVSIIFIILGSIPFIAYLKYLAGNKKIFFQDVQIKGLIYICLISTIIITLNLFIKEHGNFFSNLRYQLLM